MDDKIIRWLTEKNEKAGDKGGIGDKAVTSGDKTMRSKKNEKEGKRDKEEIGKMYLPYEE